MAKQTKAKAEQTPTPSEPVQTPVAEPVKAKSTKGKKATPEPVVETQKPTPVPEPVVETPTPESTTKEIEGLELDELSALSANFLNNLNKWLVTGASLKAEFKSLEKRWARELKTAQKTSKRKKRGGNRSPSGFVKPTKISDELAKFLGKSPGSEMARTDVTREINQYIRAQNLQDKENGRHIIPDAKLSALLKLNAEDKLTYFNLQKYMSQHFTKTVKAETA